MQKIKQFLESEKGKDILTVIIVVLVGLGSFELGRLSKSDRSPGIKIEYSDESANVIYAQNKTASSSNSKGFFASSRGKKYYPVNCSAGQTIKQENRIWFDSREEAEGAGYELASSCR